MVGMIPTCMEDVAGKNASHCTVVVHSKGRGCCFSFLVVDTHGNRIVELMVRTDDVKQLQEKVGFLALQLNELSYSFCR